MEITAKITLSLPNTFYRVILKYDTFEKATYDVYLVAAVIKNAKDREEAYRYIDDITGNGSLNSHFKKLYNNISTFTIEQIDGILNDSLFPVTVIDKKHHFKYYEMFDATRMENKVYSNNLRNQQDKLLELIMPKDDNIKFREISYEQEEGLTKKDIYNVIISDDEIKVNLDSNIFLPISKDWFNKVYVPEVTSITSKEYPGVIQNKISEGRWSAVNNTFIKSLENLRTYFLDEDNNVCIIGLEYIRKITLINVFGIYFFKEDMYQYNKNNKYLCEKVIDTLFETKEINTFKTKSLIVLLNIIDEHKAQNVINYFLSRKDSKEISELGLKLIKSGLEKGWNETTLESIKRYIPKSDIKYIYKIDNTLDYTLDEIIEIDDCDLSEIHFNQKREHFKEKESILNELNNKLGEITTSGIRERMKKLNNQDATYKKLKDFLNKNQGHNKIDYKQLSLEQLKKKRDIICEIYYGCYQEIKKRLEEIESDRN